MDRPRERPPSSAETGAAAPNCAHATWHACEIIGRDLQRLFSIHTVACRQRSIFFAR
jgi:hypothetical protein